MQLDLFFFFFLWGWGGGGGGLFLVQPILLIGTVVCDSHYTVNNVQIYKPAKRTSIHRQTNQPTNITHSLTQP